MGFIKPFVDSGGRVFFNDDFISTSVRNESGSTYKIDGFNYKGVYSHDVLCLLEEAANTVDFSKYPQPCMFFGERMRGALIGMTT